MSTLIIIFLSERPLLFQGAKSEMCWHSTVGSIVPGWAVRCIPVQSYVLMECWRKKFWDHWSLGNLSSNFLPTVIWQICLKSLVPTCTLLTASGILKGCFEILAYSQKYSYNLLIPSLFVPQRDQLPCLVWGAILASWKGNCSWKCCSELLFGGWGWRGP